MKFAARGLIALSSAAALFACDRSSTAPEAPTPRLVVVAGNPQQGFHNDFLPLPVTVQARHSDGSPAAGVTVRFATEPTHGRPEDPELRTAADGTATTRWQLGTAPAQRLTATALETGSTVTFTAQAHDPRNADIVEFTNAEGEIAVALLVLDAVSAVITLPAGVTTLRLPPLQPGTAAPEVAAFVAGRRPLVIGPERWTAARDTVRVTFEPPLPLHLAVHIVTGEFETRAALVRSELDLLAGVLAANRTGIVLGEVTIHDATGVGAPNDMTCAAPGTGAVGRVSRRINVYYVRTVGALGGMACPPHTVFMSEAGQGFSPALLAHEIGRALDLPSLHEAANLMNPAVLGRQLTAGQVFRAHFSESSALHAVYEAVAPQDVRSCWLPQGRTRGCPPPSLRAW